MAEVWKNLTIGIAGSLLATAIAAIIILIFRNLFSAERYIRNQNKSIIEIKNYSENVSLLYLVTLRDLVLMNVLFFADSAFWNFGELLIYSSELQREVLLINASGLFTIRLSTVVVLIIGLWIAARAINRINRVLVYWRRPDRAGDTL